MHDIAALLFVVGMIVFAIGKNVPPLAQMQNWAWLFFAAAAFAWFAGDLPHGLSRPIF